MDPHRELKRATARYRVGKTSHAELESVTLTRAEPIKRQRLVVDHYQQVIDGLADLGFPLSIHLQTAYGANTAAFDTFAAMLDHWSPPKPHCTNII